MHLLGTHLPGPTVAPNARPHSVSLPLARGSVQFAGDGVATTLMANHQITGGFPGVVTVLDFDLDAFTQTSPGQTLRFQPVGIAEATALARHHAERYRHYIARLHQRNA